MEKISNTEELKDAIRKLEQKQAEEWAELKRQSSVAFENAKPSQFLKAGASDIMTIHESKDDMWATALSLTAGYLAKRLIVQKSESPVTQLMGTVVQFGVTNLIANNADVIKMAAIHVFDMIVSDKKVIQQPQQ